MDWCVGDVSPIGLSAVSLFPQPERSFAHACLLSLDSTAESLSQIVTVPLMISRPTSHLSQTDPSSQDTDIVDLCGPKDIWTLEPLVNVIELYNNITLSGVYLK